MLSYHIIMHSTIVVSHSLFVAVLPLDVRGLAPLLLRVLGAVCALNERVEHRAQLGGLLMNLKVLLLDLLNVVVQSEHLRELLVVSDFVHHFLGQANILLLIHF